jgi:hypothetical protein
MMRYFIFFSASERALALSILEPTAMTFLIPLGGHRA